MNNKINICKPTNILVLFSFILLTFLLYYVFFIKSEKNEKGEKYEYEKMNQSFPEQQDADISSYKGSDLSGSVWLNGGYDVRKEDPGLSWVL